MRAVKLKVGDEIRVIAPSRSMQIISKENQEIASRKLQELGFKVSFSKHCEEMDDFSSSSIESRIEDLHEAFLDRDVKAILTVIGGFNANQLLKYIDYQLIKDNPKIFCGYSDITALSNAIYAKTGLVTYTGPHFSTFGMRKGLDYTVEHFRKCLMEEAAYELEPALEWSDDPWYREQEARTFYPNPGYRILNEGQASGVLVGGNLCTFNLLQGTEFMPDLKDKIILMEDDEISDPETFDRDLQSLIHQPGFDKVRGIIIGRAQLKSAMTADKLAQIIKTKRELVHIPVIAEVDYGHTTPMVTFPIGGEVEMIASGRGRITVLEH